MIGRVGLIKYKGGLRRETCTSEKSEVGGKRSVRERASAKERVGASASSYGTASNLQPQTRLRPPRQSLTSTSESSAYTRQSELASFSFLLSKHTNSRDCALLAAHLDQDGVVSQTLGCSLHVYVTQVEYVRSHDDHCTGIGSCECRPSHG